MLFKSVVCTDPQADGKEYSGLCVNFINKWSKIFFLILWVGGWPIVVRKNSKNCEGLQSKCLIIQHNPMPQPSFCAGEGLF